MVLLIEAVRAARRRTTGTSSVERVVPSSAPLPATQLALLCAGRESGRVQLNAVISDFALKVPSDRLHSLKSTDYIVNHIKGGGARRRRLFCIMIE